MALEPKSAPPKVVATPENGLSKLEAHMLNTVSPTYNAYYNGKMSYKLAGRDWEQHVLDAFPDLKNQSTSENVFKTVIDLYAENLVPQPEQLRGFSNVLVPLLSRGSAPVIILKDGTVSFPEHYEMISDGRYTVAVAFTRSLEHMLDYATFVYSSGLTRLFGKPVPDDMSPPGRDGYKFIEQDTGAQLFRFALDDKGMGGTLSALQDRVNHSILDQTIIAEMYARPFWYLLGVELPVLNPYMPAANQPDQDAMRERKIGSGPRIFTSNGEGPFGQLEPPTLGDVVTYHDSIINKVPLTTGIPAHYFKPGEGTPPTGVALKVLSKRFNNRIARIRDDLQLELERLCAALGVPRTVPVTKPAGQRTQEQLSGLEEDAAAAKEETMEYALWNTDDDLLQESMDAHGISLSQMGYPLGYIAEVVTPGVDLDEYEDDSLGQPTPTPQGGIDMTAMGQTGLPATPGQVASYARNPGQRAR